MKPLFLLSLVFVACAVDPVDPVEAVSVSTAEVGASTQGCTSSFWSCEPNCVFGGGQNVLIAFCDGVPTRIAELPCSPEGCF